jgi:hypothetical protein
MRVRICYLLFLWLLFPAESFAQKKPLAKRVILDWKFFKNDRPHTSRYTAYTSYRLTYKYSILPTDSTDEKMSLRFEVSLLLDTAKSYFQFSRRADGQKILKHEQGHADIGVLHAEKLKQAFAEKTFFKRNYRETISMVFYEVWAAMQTENKRYDEETEGSNNSQAQRMWDLYFDSKFVN